MRMSYETYLALKSLLMGEQQKLHKEYVIALGFLPYSGETYPVVTETAHKVYRDRQKMLTTQLEELHAAAAATYKDHPNPDMRKFWGLTS
jgi:hypothetical protein